MAAHTDGDTVVSFPGPDILAVGDIFRGVGYPKPTWPAVGRWPASSRDSARSSTARGLPRRSSRDLSADGGSLVTWVCKEVVAKR